MLFEEKERVNNSPRTYIESSYEYLDRSSRIESVNVRKFLNEWIEKFPKEDAEEIITRIKKGSKSDHDSAIFEVMLFALLTSVGCKLDIHPELNNGSTRRPDFHVTTPEGDEFYLEAVLASDYSAEEKAAEVRKNVVLEAIEKLESPDFRLGIRTQGDPEVNPPGRILRKHISKFLAELDYEQVVQAVEEQGYAAFPKTQWIHEGWVVEVQAFPKRPDKRGKNERVIGMEFSGVRSVNSWEPIRDAIRAKGNRYGKFEKPFLIAVNTDAFSLDRIDEMQALFGQEEFLFTVGDPEAQPEMRRKGNGAWQGEGGPQYTRVSGAWLFGWLSPWNVVEARNTLYENPWAEHPLSKLFIERFHFASVVEDKMVWSDGTQLSEMLSLDESWPT